MTETSPELRSLLRQLLYAHHAARQLGEHEASYHLLSAAAHAAESLSDTATLEHVAELGRGELAWLLKNQPDHRIVSGITTPGHQSVFEQLAVTATAMRQRISAAQAVERAHDA
ncbi:MAG TPA: hypothetical protein VFJ82_13865 [Longimicrobium sp.]|nr:hypothetical protein [Longimicrobium sp.]